MHLQRESTWPILHIDSVALDRLGEREDKPLLLCFIWIGGAVTFSSFRGLRSYAIAKPWRSSKHGTFEWFYISVFVAVIQLV